ELKRPNARRPSQVIFADSCNDIFVPFLYTGAVDVPWQFNKRWSDAALKFGTLQGGFDYLIGTNTWTLVRRFTQQTLASRFRQSPSETDRLAHQVVDRFLQNIRIVDGLSRSFGFRYAFFWLPVSNDVFRLPVDKTVSLIRSAAEGHFHDLTDVFAGHSSNF